MKNDVCRMRNMVQLLFCTINPTEFQLSSNAVLKLPTICHDINDRWFIDTHLGIVYDVDTNQKYVF